MISSLKLSLFSSVFLALSFTNISFSQTDTSAIELNIFPNPNRGTFYITTIEDESYQSQLLAMDGSVVKTMNLNSGLNYVSIDTKPGVYMLKVDREEKEEQFRVVIK